MAHTEDYRVYPTSHQLVISASHLLPQDWPSQSQRILNFTNLKEDLALLQS
jgi:hypothetical protein